jgi:hypothetical protein
MAHSYGRGGQRVNGEAVQAPTRKFRMFPVTMGMKKVEPSNEIS